MSVVVTPYFGGTNIQAVAVGEPYSSSQTRMLNGYKRASVPERTKALVADTQSQSAW